MLYFVIMKINLLNLWLKKHLLSFVRALRPTLVISIFIHGLMALLFVIVNHKNEPEVITYKNKNSLSAVLNDHAVTEIQLLETQTKKKVRPKEKNQDLKLSQTEDTQKEAKTGSTHQNFKRKSKINFIGKSSAEILNDRLNASSKNHEPYFKDNQFRPTKDNYDTFSNSGALGYFNEGGIEKSFENNNFYVQLWRKVRSLTSFPKEFAAFQLSGRVRVDLIVNRRGQMMGDFLKVSSANPLLEMYTLTVLTVALSSPLNKNYWTKDDQIPISFDFEYNLIHDPLEHSRLENHLGHYNANLFHFVSNRYVPSPFEQTIADFYRDYVPPVLITPMGAGFVDLGKLYEFYQKWKTNDWRLAKEKRKDNVKELKKVILFAIQNPSESLLKKINNISLPDFKRNQGGPLDLIYLSPNPNNPSLGEAFRN